MIKKHILNDQRIRRIDGGFSFIPHRFLTDGFLSALNPHQLLSKVRTLHVQSMPNHRWLVFPPEGVGPP